MRTALVVAGFFVFIGALGGTVGGLASHEITANGGPVWGGLLVSLCVGLAIGFLLGVPLFETVMDATEDWRSR